MSSPSLSASCAAVRTCAVSGKVAATSRLSASSDTPGLAATNAKSTWLGFWNSCCAVFRSKITTVAPPKLVAEPRLAKPTSLNFRFGWLVATVTSSPSLKSCLSAVPESSAISSGPAGGRPCWIVTAANGFGM